MLLALLQEPTTQVPTAEAVLFWVLAPIALGAAIAMIFSRNAVHAALLLVANFFCLAVFYAAQDAPFLAAVQVIVYTGAIMVLFLFVLMLIGVDANESLTETIRGHRIASVVVSLGLAGVVISALGRSLLDTGAVGLDEANTGGNVLSIAKLLFGAAPRGGDSYFLAFEMTSALLITAAVGSMVLTHRERGAGKKSSQREQSIARFKGTHPTPLSGPGVYATSHSEQEPALLPGGEPLEGSAVDRVQHGPGSAE